MGQFMPARKGGRKPPSLFRSLCVSMASIMLSLIMLVGTTMAWFNESISTGTYTITAGNISTSGAQYLTSDGSWAALPTPNDTSVTLFAGTYTPGDAKTVGLKLHNDGTLTADYRVSLQLAGDSGANELSNRLKYGYKTFTGDTSEQDLRNFVGQSAADRAIADSYEKCDTLSAHDPKTYAAQNTTCSVTLDSGAETYLALSIFMPAATSTEGLAEGQNTVQVQLTVIASQQASDVAAPEAWDGQTATATENLKKDDNGVYLISSPADLAGVANILRNAGTLSLSECSLRLMTDINMNDQPWIPIDTTASVTLYGDGHTIYNLTAGASDSSTNAGLFGTVASLKAASLTLSGGSATATNTAGMLAGTVIGSAELTSVCVQNVTVTAPTANPMIGSGNVTESGCNAANYTINTGNP